MIIAKQSHENRKTLSEKKLKNLGIKTNSYLPPLEENVSIKSKEELVERLIALTIVTAKALDAPNDKVEKFIRNFNANRFFTQSEKRFILNSNPSLEESNLFSWNVEAAWILMWTLGLVPHIENEIIECDADYVFMNILSSSQGALIAKSNVRKKEEILDYLDYIYRLHWAIKDSSVKGRTIPLMFNYNIVFERHYTLNWATSYLEQSWDDMKVNT